MFGTCTTLLSMIFPPKREYTLSKKERYRIYRRWSMYVNLVSDIVSPSDVTIGSKIRFMIELDGSSFTPINENNDLPLIEKVEGTVMHEFIPYSLTNLDQELLMNVLSSEGERCAMDTELASLMNRKCIPTYLVKVNIGLQNSMDVNVIFATNKDIVIMTGQPRTCAYITNYDVTLIAKMDESTGCIYRSSPQAS